MKQMTFLQYWMVVFFTVHSVSGEKVVAKCNKCNPAKPISGSYAATSNFLLHLKRVHPSLIHEFENYRDTVQREKNLTRKGGKDDQHGEPSKKQAKLDFSKPKTVSQSTVNNLGVFCISNTITNKYFVFCILAVFAEVFDKSISNTFLESILYFVFKYFKKSIFYNSDCAIATPTAHAVSPCSSR
jgi:hypothetical protein